MEATFYVLKDKVNSKGLAPLRMSISKSGLRVLINVGISVIPKAWNHKEQKLYNIHGQGYSSEINKKLLHRKSIISQIDTEADLKGIELTKEYIKKRFNELLNPSKKEEVKEEIDFFGMFDFHSEKYKHLKSKEYIRGFIQVKGHLKKFNSKLNFQDITHKFYSDYMNYLVDIPIQNNTISNHFRKIKVIMNEALKQGIKIPMDYQDFKNVARKPAPVWLTKKEIDLIDNYKTDNKTHEAVKDLFILRFNLGIRFSDLPSIKRQNILEKGGISYLNFDAVKTSTFNQIAINKKALSIIQKYDYDLPKLTLQAHNRIIKDVAKNAEVTDKITKVRYSGSKRIEETLPKYKFIGTHTARRSFARYWAEKGGDLLKLSRYLGHSSIEITLDYIGYDKIEINDEYLRLFD